MTTVANSSAPGSLVGARVPATCGGWQASGVFVGIVLFAGAAFWPSTQSLVHEWLYVATTSYGHGLLAVLVAIVLGVRALRSHGGEARPEPHPLRWLTLLAVSSFAWLVAVRAGIQIAHQLLLPGMVWLAVRAALGARAARLTFVPVALFYSAIPLWHLAVPALQGMTVSVVGALLRASGIAAYVDGDYVFVRNGAFHVEEGCAGLRYLIVGTTIAAVLGELREDRWRTRIALVLLGASLSLIANWARVFVVVLAGYLTDMQHYLVRVEHVRFGWVVFALMMCVFIGAARWWITPRPDPAPSAEMDAAPAPLRVASLLWTMAAIATAALLGPVWSWASPVRNAAAVNVVLPPAIAGWSQAGEGCSLPWRPQFAGADLESMREYDRGGHVACAFVATYLLQRQDKELVGYHARPFAGAGDLASATVRGVGPRAVIEARLEDRGGAERLVWYTYVIGDAAMVRGIEAQLSYGTQTLFGAPASSILALAAPCAPDCAAAAAALAELLPHVVIGSSND